MNHALKMAKKAIMIMPMPASLKQQFIQHGLKYLINDVEIRTAELMKEYESVSKKQWMHLNQILPCIAFYEVLVTHTHDKEKALRLYENWCLLKIEKMAKIIPVVMKIPGLYRLIPSLMNQMLEQMFGHASGFDYQRKDCECGFAVDMLSCPYVNACKKYNCMEIAPYFCKSDDLCYGNMHPKLVWGRVKTLGMGDECCDFKMTIKK